MRLELKNITHEYKGLKILEDCNYIFNGGKIYSIQGSNGSGKTTLFNIINGFTSPKNGSIFINNNFPISNKSVYQRNCEGILRSWQKGEVFDNLSTIDNLCVVPKHKGNNLLNYLFKSKQTQKQEKYIYSSAINILKMLGLLKHKDDLVRDLSFGQQRIASFGRILMDERIFKGKTIILLDEPFSGIQTEILKVISSKIQEISQYGNIILIVEHNQYRANEIADIKLEIQDKRLKELK